MGAGSVRFGSVSVSFFGELFDFLSGGAEVPGLKPPQPLPRHFEGAKAPSNSPNKPGGSPVRFGSVPCRFRAAAGLTNTEDHWDF